MGQVVQSGEYPAQAPELVAEIASLTAANRVHRDLDLERRLLQLRYRLGVALAAEPGDEPTPAPPDDAPLPDGAGLPSFARRDLRPERLRSAILRDGCMIVRGLVDQADAERLAGEVERAFDERRRAGEHRDPGYYEAFQGGGGFKSPARGWIQKTGGLLMADSPRLTFDILDVFASAGVLQVVADYLGEAAALSVEKSTLRRVRPDISGAWHQDGSFMGGVSTLNVWLSLSHCGDDAPGLDIVPRRLASLVTGGRDGTEFPNIEISQTTAERASAGQDIVRPIFQPGDAVLFDELCLHKTASDPSMGNDRYAVESWFFGCSRFPAAYSPLAVAGG